MYTNYKYANSFGNRCAVFARPSGVGLKRTEVFILECSRKDPFSRKRAREVYQNYLKSEDRRKERGDIMRSEIPFYVKMSTTRLRSPSGEVDIKEEGKAIPCHPQIIELPFQFNNERITRFCETFLKRWISRQEVRRITSEVFEDYQIEK